MIEPLVLSSTEIPPLPLHPGFSELVREELANAATPADGFNTVLSEAVGIIDALDAALGGLGNELLNAFGEADTIDAAPVLATVQGFAAAAGVGSAAVSSLGIQVTSGGTAGHQKPASASATITAAQAAAAPLTRVFTIFNQLIRPVHLFNFRTSSQVPSAWSYLNECGTVIQPGVTCRIPVTLHHAVPVGTRFTLTMDTDGAFSPVSLILTVIA